MMELLTCYGQVFFPINNLAYLLIGLTYWSKRPDASILEYQATLLLADCCS